MAGMRRRGVGSVAPDEPGRSLHLEAALDSYSRDRVSPFLVSFLLDLDAPPYTGVSTDVHGHTGFCALASK
jgi:hypothetical protein